MAIRINAAPQMAGQRRGSASTTCASTSDTTIVNDAQKVTCTTPNLR